MRICRECGKEFEPKSKREDHANVNCPECVKRILNDFMTALERKSEDEMYFYDCDPTAKPKPKKKPEIYKVAKAAADAGMSYGYYIADRRGKK